MTVDNLSVGQGISDAAVAAGMVVDVLAKMGGLDHRTGAPTVPELLTLAQNLDRLPGLRLRGVGGLSQRPGQWGGDFQAVTGLQRAGLSCRRSSAAAAHRMRFWPTRCRRSRNMNPAPIFLWTK